MAPEETDNREIDKEESDTLQPETGGGGGEGAPVSCIWRVHLAALMPAWKTAVFVTALLVLLAMTYLVFKSWIPVAVFAVVLFLFFEDFIFPLRFEIGREGVSASGYLLFRRKIGWEKVRRCAANDKGVLCSPFAKPSLLDGTRGVFLRFDGKNREEVIENVRRFRDAAGSQNEV